MTAHCATRFQKISLQPVSQSGAQPGWSQLRAQPGQSLGPAVKRLKRRPRQQVSVVWSSGTLQRSEAVDLSCVFHKGTVGSDLERAGAQCFFGSVARSDDDDFYVKPSSAVAPSWLAHSP